MVLGNQPREAGGDAFMPRVLGALTHLVWAPVL